MTTNKANIRRDEFKDHPAQAQSKLNLTLSGSNLTPWGFEYQGSAVIHFYKKPGTHDFIFISQSSGMTVIPEGQSDLGLKELRRYLMGLYGREDTRRKDV